MCVANKLCQVMVYFNEKKYFSVFCLLFYTFCVIRNPFLAQDHKEIFLNFL